jgi:hypothetical protein
VFAIGFFALLLCNVLFLTTVWHYSALRAGAALTPGLIAAAAMAPRPTRRSCVPSCEVTFRMLSLPGLDRS